MRGYRVGVVAPLSPFGKRVREELESRAFPVIELKLFEVRADGGAALTQFQDEIVVTESLDVDLFPHLDLIFFPAGADRRGDKAAAAVRQGVLTFVSDDLGVEAPVVIAGVNDRSLPEMTRLLVAPRSASILIGTVLAAIERSLPIARACATVLLPALDLGKAGAEELHRQVVEILNFRPPPKKILPEQLAFNVMLAREPQEKEGGGETAVEREVQQIAGLKRSPAVTLVRTPVFHGYAASLWLQTAETAEPEALGRALRACRRISVPRRRGKGSPSSPSAVSVSESDRIHVALRPDGASPGGFWLWIVADSGAVDPARTAVALAAA
ncbi:MAG: Asd/ArgC dimerization domain-containing protein, partial [Acidobacteriota bacterium]